MSEYSNPYDYEEQAPPPDAQWSARRALAEAVRRLNTLSVTTVADAEQLQQVAEAVQQQVDLLAQQPQRGGRMAHIDPERDGQLQRSVVSHELSPLSGLCNPLSAPMNLWFEDDEVRARVTLGWPYEGPPGCVHGGFIAALFDEFLGMGQKLSKQPGFTGTLNIRYIKPTPLHRELNLRGRLVRIDGRKNILRGEMYAGEILTASCEGLFVHMPPDYLQRQREAMQ